MSADILEALRDLRKDPAIAAILEQGQSQDSPRPRDATSTPQPTKKPGEQYYSERDAEREHVGVGNWLQRHRDDLSNSEAKRVDSRLRSEHMFALSQLEFERFMAEKKLHEEELTKALDKVGSKPAPQEENHDDQVLRCESIDREVQTTYVVETTAGSLPAAAVVPAEALFAGDPENSGKRRMLDVPSVMLDTVKDLGPLDEDANYAKKVEQMGLQMPSAASYRSPRPTVAETTEISALKEAVNQRDSTIRRLERLIREDRDYYESAISKHKAETEQQRLLSESRIAALRGQIDQLVTDSEATKRKKEEDWETKLEKMQSAYDQSVNTIRAQAEAQLTAAHEEVERTVRDVVARADASVRQARDAYRLERSEVLGREKDSLAARLAKELDVLIREAELRLREDVEGQLLEKLQHDMEKKLRGQMRSELMPLVQSQLVADVRANLIGIVEQEVQGVYAQKALELEKQVRREMAIAEKNFLASLAAAQRGSKGSDGALDHFKHDEAAGAAIQLMQSQLNKFSTLQEAAEKAVKEQEELDDEHRRKLKVVERQKESLERMIDLEQRKMGNLLS